MTTTGSKYAGWQDAATIAKNVRADIKQAQKDGSLPKDIKVSVRCEKYSMGQSVNVTLTGWSPDAIRTDDGYTPAARAAITAFDRYREAYNRNNSDPMTDYYDVTYYGNTSWGF